VGLGGAEDEVRRHPLIAMVKRTIAMSVLFVEVFIGRCTTSILWSATACRRFVTGLLTQGLLSQSDGRPSHSKVAVDV